MNGISKKEKRMIREMHGQVEDLHRWIKGIVERASLPKK